MVESRSSHDKKHHVAKHHVVVNVKAAGRDRSPSQSRAETASPVHRVTPPQQQQQQPHPQPSRRCPHPRRIILGVTSSDPIDIPLRNTQARRVGGLTCPCTSTAPIPYLFLLLLLLSLRSSRATERWRGDPT
jgi:hypothetical protein